MVPLSIRAHIILKQIFPCKFHRLSSKTVLTLQGTVDTINLWFRMVVCLPELTDRLLSLYFWWAGEVSWYDHCLYCGSNFYSRHEYIISYLNERYILFYAKCPTIPYSSINFAGHLYVNHKVFWTSNTQRPISRTTINPKGLLWCSLNFKTWTNNFFRKVWVNYFPHPFGESEISWTLTFLIS